MQHFCVVDKSQISTKPGSSERLIRLTNQPPCKTSTPSSFEWKGRFVVRWCSVIVVHAEKNPTDFGARDWRHQLLQKIVVHCVQWPSSPCERALRAWSVNTTASSPYTHLWLSRLTKVSKNSYSCYYSLWLPAWQKCPIILIPVTTGVALSTKRCCAHFCILEW